jgi:hypothetical protein
LPNQSTIRNTPATAVAVGNTRAFPSRAWVELVAHHVDDAPTFAAMLAVNPVLLDKRLLGRHYRSATLASAGARGTWQAPDLAPFPWTG